MEAVMERQEGPFALAYRLAEARSFNSPEERGQFERSIVERFAPSVEKLLGQPLYPSPSWRGMRLCFQAALLREAPHPLKKKASGLILPPPCWIQLFTYLKPKDISALRNTGKWAYAQTQRDAIWAAICPSGQKASAATYFSWHRATGLVKRLLVERMISIGTPLEKHHHREFAHLVPKLLCSMELPSAQKTLFRMGLRMDRWEGDESGWVTDHTDQLDLVRLGQTVREILGQLGPSPVILSKQLNPFWWQEGRFAKWAERVMSKRPEIGALEVALQLQMAPYTAVRGQMLVQLSQKQIRTVVDAEPHSWTTRKILLSLVELSKESESPSLFSLLPTVVVCLDGLLDAECFNLVAPELQRICGQVLLRRGKFSSQEISLLTALRPYLNLDTLPGSRYARLTAV